MRKLKRMVAHERMKKRGLTQVNKCKGDASYFSKHWREYVGGK